jgi:MoxR-like ATPase
MSKKNNTRQPRATAEIKNQFIELALKEYGDTITRSQALSLCDDHDLPIPTWLMNSGKYSAGRGLYAVPDTFESGSSVPAKKTSPKKKAKATPKMKQVAQTVVDTDDDVATGSAASSVRSQSLIDLVPPKSKNFVPFGSFKDVHTIISSGMFYPTFITGLSGNGKTFGVEQACAKAKRECVRVNLTIETDEDDLIGGFRLVDGNTVFQKGPVVEAMERGAVLLLDEIDLASNKIMCLQPVLEGKPLFLKKIGEVVHPADGFNVVATANTKGKGDEAGRFIGTNVLNEAFLERFPITFEQPYPSMAIEKKIVAKELDILGCPDADFADKLVKWADTIRKTFFDGGVDEIIATRRLIHVAKAFSIFGDKLKAVELCVARFDDETRESFLETYRALDGKLNVSSDDAQEIASEDAADSIGLSPF